MERTKNNLTDIISRENYAENVEISMIFLIVLWCSMDCPESM